MMCEAEGRSMLKAVALSVTLLLSMSVAHAEEEQEASAEETARINDVIGQIGCKAEAVEKESADLFEIDDAICAIGQYDIKLNAAYKITSMTLDE
jgi:hypothetical protein